MQAADWREFLPVERRKVTICIAAACSTEDGPRIVICSDHKVSNFLGSNETGFKQRRIKRGWLCLFAGEVTAARDLHFLIRKGFESADRIDETNVKGLVEAAVNQRKRELVNQYVQGEFGICYDEFYKTANERIPSVRCANAFAHISSIKIGAQLLVAGFADGVPTIIETDDKCGVQIIENFSAIGEGRYLAHSVLLHREQEDINPVGITLYNVYEAKKHAQRIVSVGESTLLGVLLPDGDTKMVMPSGMKYLEQKYDEYGPKKIKSLPEFELDPRYFTGYDDDKA